MRLAKQLFLIIAGLLCLVFVALLALHHDGSITTEVWIDSPPQTVWKILTDTADYPRWNPEISRLDGALVEGNVIEFAEGSGPDAMVFHPTVLTVRPGRELKWKGFLWIPGLFDGEHRFQLVEAAEGNRTLFIQSERFSGILVGKLSDGALSDTAALMKQMNAALKTRAEAAKGN
ncbi:SRPBCC domain-containing protein [Paraburkholderia sp. BCC1885]|uniref:SRPBCC domain-containing protein n=1 Tax=Paraburkholderia sp. BCC1885 TaxID=2562669 RepID=UPI0011843AF6|nr:SRPBCC domain-containing protein [Paraburkholderia sp. BCC1885]